MRLALSLAGCCGHFNQPVGSVSGEKCLHSLSYSYPYELYRLGCYRVVCSICNTFACHFLCCKGILIRMVRKAVDELHGSSLVDAWLYELFFSRQLMLLSSCSCNIA